MEYFIELDTLNPKIMIAYDRIAFFGKENKEFRVTFDRNIRSRTDDLDLLDGTHGEALLDDSTVIMECKCVGGLPLWLTKELTSVRIFPASFSKYGEIYKKHGGYHYLETGVCVNV
ncbi:MAG: VTC domain-containing protein [Oscillospiraceae bacterium]